MDSAQRQATAFGKYALLERVSVGGMAEVFKAKAFGVEGFEKILAIKRILPSMAEDADFIEMFIDEAKICGQLNHANICQIYELGRVGDAHFIAMEYVWGKDVLQIQNRFRKLRQKMKPEMAAYIACKICEGLDYAHKKKDAAGKPLGIIHRDISPQNILISYEGELKVIDFGIAKAASRSSKTQAGVLKGKFGYMSPEQVRGLPLDRRSDIFAIGTILYELLTAERLFYGDSDFETLEKVRNVDVPPPSQVNPATPKTLEKIILRALSKDVEGRYQWAAEMAEDLNAFLLGHDPVFSAQNLSQWMREQFAVEMRRERLVLDEQQKVTRDVVASSAAASASTTKPARPPQKSVPKSPAVPARPPPPPPQAVASDDGDDDDDFNEKTTVSGPAFDQPTTDPAALPEQSTRILDGGGPPGAGGELAALSTVVFSEGSGQSRSPPSKPTAMPLGPAEPSVLVYGQEPSTFTPHYGQLVAPAPLPRAPKSTVWKDILIGVALAAAAVGGVVGGRAYLARRGQGTLALISPSGAGEVVLDGAPRGQIVAATPMTFKGLSVGDHTLVVRGDAGEFKQVVTLVAGDVNVVTVSFAGSSVEAGKLKLEVEAQGPAGEYASATADVYIDGAQLSSDAVNAPISLRAGVPHEVRVQKSGLAEQHFTVQIKVGETMVRPVRLAWIGGKIAITSEPSGAEVTVNGRRIGLTPTNVSELDTQRIARISLRLAGYQSVTKSISFDRGAEQTLEVRLVAEKEGKEPPGEAVEAKADKPAEKSEPKATEKPAEKPVEKAEKPAEKADKPEKPVEKAEKPEKPTKSGWAKKEAPKETTPKETTPPAPVAKPAEPKDKFPSEGLAQVSFGQGESKAGAQDAGFLVANTQPWAKVLIDGKDTGKTTPIAPRSKIALKPGKHVVTFVVAGKKYNFDIVVKPGEEVRLIKQLTDAAP